MSRVNEPSHSLRNGDSQRTPTWAGDYAGLLGLHHCADLRWDISARRARGKAQSDSVSAFSAYPTETQVLPVLGQCLAPSPKNSEGDKGTGLDTLVHEILAVFVGNVSRKELEDRDGVRRCDLSPYPQNES